MNTTTLHHPSAPTEAGSGVRCTRPPVRRHRLLARLVLAASFAAATATIPIRAAEISAEDAKLAAEGWLIRNPRPMGSEIAGYSADGVKTVFDENGRALFHLVHVAGGGTVVMSADDGVNPVIAFTESNEIEENDANPFYAVLKADLAARLDAVSAVRGEPADGKRKFSVPAKKKNGSENANDTEVFETSDDPLLAKHENVWRNLVERGRDANNVKLPKQSVGTLSDVRRAAMLTSTWGQLDPFNSKVPGGFPVGCNATAFGQIMYYHHCRGWLSDRNFEWDSMPLDAGWKWIPYVTGDDGYWSSSLTTKQKDAVGNLLYTLAEAFGTTYGSDVSTASLDDATAAMKSRFGYASSRYMSADISTPNNLIDYEAARNALLASLDCYRPCIVGLSKNKASVGHVVVVDGYGFDSSSTLYCHLNVGADGSGAASANTWYNLMGETIRDKWPLLHMLAYNIDPQWSGWRLSGRVLGKDGKPVSGATVKMSLAAGETPYTTTTDDKGIYAFGFSGATSISLEASYGTEKASTDIVVSSGNVWGVDFQFGSQDVVLLIDSTGSMSGAISSAKSSAVAIVNKILGGSSGTEAKTQSRVAVVEYRDKDDPFVYRANATFTSDASTAISAINSISLGDGGDIPEALYAALHGIADGGAGAWVNPERHIIVMTDAPAHDPDLVTGDTKASITKILNEVTTTWKAEKAGASAKTNSGTSGAHLHLVYLGSDSTTSATYNDLATATGGTCQTGVEPAEAADAILDVLTTIKEGGSSSLAAAVDNTALSFTTGGDADWFSESYETFDGVDAAQSGDIRNNEETWLQATGASGEGIISFRWKVSSEQGYDWLDFYVDGELLFGRSGESEWRHEAFKIGPGTHTFQWIYSKDGSYYAGEDCAWVDMVKWTPGTPLVPVYRFYSKNYKGHFFTCDEYEMFDLVSNNPNWNYEGVAYFVRPSSSYDTTPLYRFYSKNYRGHFYTTDYDEYWTVRYTNPNWRYEGIAYYARYSSGAGAKPVYRFWSKGYRHHFYTIGYDEYWNLRRTNPNWNYEGIAFYAWAEPDDFLDYAMAGPAKTSATVPGGPHDDAPWTLAGPDSRPLETRGVTEADGRLVETRGEAPEAEELEHAEVDSHAEFAEDAEHFRLALPPGLWNAMLWSAEKGVVAEETVEGAFEFNLPAYGVWHWLRVQDGDDEDDSSDAFSLWLRAE